MTKAKWYYYPLFAALLLFVWCGSASAQMAYAPGGMGDLLLGASYDVRDNDDLTGSYADNERQAEWQNFLEFQNTSGDWVATHLRFREGEKSIEVWDHPILLSPYDVFWCYLMKIEGGGVMIASSDWSTLYHSGLISKQEHANQMVQYRGETFTTTTGQTFNQYGYYPQWVDTFSDALASQIMASPSLEYGEFEIIGLWSFDGTDHTGDGFIHKLEYDQVTREGLIWPTTYSKGGQGQNANIFDILRNVWGSATGDPPADWGAVNEDIASNPPPAYPYGPIFLEDVDNVLKGTMQMGDGTSGQMYVYSLTAIQDFRTATGPHRDGYGVAPILFPPDLYYNHGFYGLWDNDHVYTVTEPAWYLNPDWATVKGPTLRDGDNAADENVVIDIDAFNDIWSLNDVEDALAKGPIWTFYFNDEPFVPGQTISTDLVLTFPTKYLHFNIRTMPWWVNGFERKSQYQTAVTNFRAGLLNPSPIWLEAKIWDTEQNFPVGVITPSPQADYVIPMLPREANIIRLSDFLGLTDNPEDILFEDTWAFGQLTLFNWWLTSLPGFASPQWDFSSLDYQLPVIGYTIRVHHSGTIAYRSAAHQWQWVAP